MLVAAAAAAVPPLKRMARIARDKLDRKNAKEKLARAEAHALQALVGACGGTTSSSSVEIQSRQKKKACDGRGATLGNAHMLIHRAKSAGYAAVCSIQQHRRALGAPATARRPLDPRTPQGPAIDRF